MKWHSHLFLTYEVATSEADEFHYPDLKYNSSDVKFVRAIYLSSPTPPCCSKQHINQSSQDVKLAQDYHV